MKKIVSFLVASFILYGATAQTVLLDEGFENGLPTGWVVVDNDGDGFNWEISSGNFVANTGTYCIVSASYDMETNNPLTPDNYLITSAIAIPTGGAELSWYVTGQDQSYYAEKYEIRVSTTGQTAADFSASPIFSETVQTGQNYQFKEVSLSAYAGQTIYIAFIHTDITDMFYLNIDDIKVTANPTDPTIIAGRNQLDFGIVPNATSSQSQTVNIKTYNLTSPVIATTTTPFEVSADNITFGTSATLSKDTFYVRYSPTVAGTQSSIVVLSSTGAVNDTINVSGESKVCNIISSFPYEYGFERDQGEHICWQTIDANNDAQYGFGEFTFMDYEEGDGIAACFHPLDSISPSSDDWLISPVVSINTDLEASFDYLIGMLPQLFSIWVIHEDSTYTDARLLVPTKTVMNTEYETAVIDLRNLRGNYRIAINVETPIYLALTGMANYFYFVIDNFKVKEAIPSLTSTQSTLNLGDVAMGNTAETTLTFSAVNVPEAINITANAPFEVSYDGGAFSNSIQIQGEAELNYSKELNIRINGTSVGTFNGVLRISSANVEDTLKIALTSKVVDCSGVVTLPYTEGFENAWLPSACWSNLDVDNDGNFWGKHTVNTDAHSGSACASSYSSLDSTSLSPNNYLITPKLRIPAQGATLSYWVAAQNASKPQESYIVRVSTTGNAASDFSTVIKSDMLNRAQWVNASVSLNQFAGQDIYIAFIHTNVTNQSMLKLDDISITAGVGIAELPLDDSSISIHPNPAKEILNISASSAIDQVEIYSISGQLVYSSQANNQNLTINTSDYAQGLYIVKIYTEEGFATKKISIVK